MDRRGVQGAGALAPTVSEAANIAKRFGRSCKNCRNQPEVNSIEQNYHQESELSTEKIPNHIPMGIKVFLLRREVESELYLRETRPFIIESAKTYV